MSRTMRPASGTGGTEEDVMKPVVEFHDWDGERDLQLHPDHVRVGEVALPYDGINGVAIERSTRGAMIDLVRLVIRLGPDEFGLALPIEDAERAKLLIQIPEAREEALYDPLLPLDGRPLLNPWPAASESGSLLDSGPLLGPPAERAPMIEGSLLEPEPPLEAEPMLPPSSLAVDADTLLLGPPLLAPDHAFEASPPPPLDGKPEPRRPQGRRLRLPVRGPADVAFSGALLLIAVGAIALLVMPLRESKELATRGFVSREGSQSSGTVGAPPATREVRPPRLAPSPATHRRHHHKKREGPRSRGTSPTRPSAPSTVPAAPSAPTAPTAPPAPSPNPPSASHPPAPIPEPSVSTAPAPSPSISIG
jgi:hypothetical protein